MKKKISIIVPVYNGEKYINIFMENIIEQTIFAQLNFIIVNDGSEDNTYEKLQNFAKKYPENIQVLTKINGGVSAARNKGLNVVESEYFAFADIDDLMHPYLFERLYQMISTSGADMVCAGTQKITTEQAEDGRPKLEYENCISTKSYNSEDAIQMLLQVPEQNAVYSKMYRTSVLGDIRFDERLAIAEDKLFVFQCMTHSKTIIVSPEVLYYYVQHPVSAMSYANAREKAGQDIVLDIIDKEIQNNYSNIYPLCVAIKAQIHAGSYIKVYTNDKDYREKCRFYRKSVVQCPLSYVFSKLKGIGRIKVLLVRYVPAVFWGIRIKRYKNLIQE